MTPRQCAAARAMLQWKQQTLAYQADVGVSTVADFERGKRRPQRAHRRAIVAAFERRGVRFVGDCGLVVL